ncbi:MAG: hypothetical protein IKP77_05670 [Acholeplasmatales bacterium]|nr:hypothetical protein [Acholeplasmatales bacterium]MBR6288575.1 hypothetical protein [Acholeplasmatales bacterium]
MNKKILMLSLTLVLLLISIITPTYAWTDEEYMNTKLKNEWGTYYVIDTFYATPNFNAIQAIKNHSDDLIWNGSFPEYDKDNEIYMDFGDYPADPDVLVLQPHLGWNKDVYSRLTRPREIESYDGKAQYVIGISNYDQVLIIIDGNTFKGNIGDILNDFFKNKVDNMYRKETEFYMPYDSAATALGVGSISRYREGEDIYMATAIYQVGFNLLKESQPTNVQDDVEDPAIYGGNDEVQIDDTPSTPEANENTAFKVVGIVISSILSVVGIYLIYLLGKKIYTIMKGQ